MLGSVDIVVGRLDVIGKRVDISRSRGLAGVSPAPVWAVLWLKVEPDKVISLLLWPRNTAPPRPPAMLLTTNKDQTD